MKKIFYCLIFLCSVNVSVFGGEEVSKNSIFSSIFPRGMRRIRLLKRPREIPNSELAQDFINQNCGLNPLSPKGFDILELALSQKDHETIKKMTKAGMDLNSEDDEGRTPLLLAILYNNFSAVQLFIQAGADVNYSGTGLSLLHSVAVQGNSAFTENSPFFHDCAKILMQAGAKIPSQEERDRTSEKCFNFIQQISEEIEEEQKQIFDAHAAFDVAKTISQGKSLHPAISQRLQRMLEIPNNN